jgi:hypothetical protein
MSLGHHRFDHLNQILIRLYKGDSGRYLPALKIHILTIQIMLQPKKVKEKTKKGKNRSIEKMFSLEKSGLG